MLCSDHHLLRLHVVSSENFVHRSFHFQDIWTRHLDFLPFVQHDWFQPLTSTNPALRLIGKLKCLKSRLKIWNVEVFRNIFTKIQHASDALDRIQRSIADHRDSDAKFEEEMNQIAMLNGLLARHQSMLT